MVREAIGTRLNREISINDISEEKIVNSCGRMISNSSQKVNNTE
jgi:hypothetical protein